MWNYVKGTLGTDHKIFEIGATGTKYSLFFTGGQIFVFRCSPGGRGRSGMGEDALGVKIMISDPVPFTVSQTSVDYQRPS